MALPVQRSTSLRSLFRNNKQLFFVSSNPCFHDSSIKTLTSNPPTPQISSLFPSQLNNKPFSSFSNPPPHFSSSSSSLSLSLSSSPFFSPPSRSFCTSKSSSSNFVVVESEKEFTSSLSKVQDDSQPAIFYFTAAWCGPCKLMSPIIEEMSRKYPHVTTYKIDVDQKELQTKLGELNISSVPTLHFFQNGKKASEMVGADVARLKQTVESLYKN